MYEDIIVNEDMTYCDILELSEQLLIPVEQLVIFLKGEKNELL